MNTQLAEIHAVHAANQEFEFTLAQVLSTTRKCWRGEEYLSPAARIGVGLGRAALCRDGEIVYEEKGEDFEALMTVGEAEVMAQADPHHEWEIHLVALLEDRCYRRVGAGRWKLRSRGYGLS